MCINFKDFRVVKSRKLGVIEMHFLAIEFMGDWEGEGWEVFLDKFPKYLRRIHGHLNSESVEKQFGRADV